VTASTRPAAREDLATARERLAAAQGALVAALVAGAPPPAGFDPARVGVQAEALLAKRRELVARVRPDIAEELGADYRACFDAYARGCPRPAAGSRADADAFARTLGRGP